MFDKKIYFKLFSKNFYLAIDYLNKEMPHSLFKYYSLGTDIDDIKIETLCKNEIWLDNFANQNDPFELINLTLDTKLSYDKTIDKANSINEYNKQLSSLKYNIKFSSFTDKMEDNISMWAYYTNNYKGFCCEYELIDRTLGIHSSIRPVFYEKNILKVREDHIKNFILNSKRKTNISSNDDFNLQLELFKVLACCKDESWKHENEYRAIILDKETVGGKAVKCKDLNIAIKSIFVGVNCSEQSKQKLIDVAKKLNIDIYQISTSSEKYLFNKERLYKSDSLK